MSLRARITLLTALLLLASSATLGVVAVVTAARIQLDAVDRMIIAAAGNPRVRGLLERPQPIPEGERAQVALGVRLPGAADITVLRPAGTATDPLPFPVLSPEEVRSALDDPTTIDGPVEYRAVARQARPGGAIVIAAAPLDQLRTEVRTFSLGMAAAVLAITAIGALAAWLTVRRFFRPMDSMVEAAQAIGTGDLDRRVPGARPGTELGALASSLNAMIVSLTAAVTRAEASEAQLRTLVSDASHEIRTPLTVIRGYVELLLQEAESSDDLTSRALRRIDTESARLQRLVDSLLDLERAERAEPKAAVRLDLLTEDAVDDLRGLDPSRTVESDVVPVVVMGDEDALRQMIANLVQNVVRHTPPGTPVQVQLGLEEDSVALILDDAGPGIAPTDRSRALERFSRLDSTAVGSGIGLAIVATVVAAHGGSIELADSPLGGLRVRVDLPGGRAGL